MTASSQGDTQDDRRDAPLGEFRVHPVTLAFSDQKLEDRFLEYFFQRHLAHWRICHVLSVVFYCIYVVVQALTIPEHTSTFLWIGFGVITPIFGIGYAVTYTRHYRRSYHFLSMFYIIATGLGALAMTALSSAQHQFFTLTGFFFSYLFGYAVIRLHFVHASIAGALLTITFLFIAPDLLGNDSATFFHGIFFVIGFNVLGMLIAYWIEQYTRRDYHSMRLLRQEQKRVTAANESLELRVQERTGDLAEKNRSLEEAVVNSRRLERERSDLEQQFQQAQKMESVGRLAGGIAHDFNNLLTVINSYASLAVNGLRKDDPLRADIQQILEAGNRAATLTKQLLAFSRKQVLEPKVIDLNEVIVDMDRMLQRLIGENIEFSTCLAQDLGRVNADPGQVEQVLMNLAVNARDAMPDCGKLTVETTNIVLDQEQASKIPDLVAGSYIMLVVSDTGQGMTSEVKSRLFEPFFTTKEKGQGTGLGLATVYGIVKQSGGSIWVQSEPGRGTAFNIYLPRIEAKKTALAPGRDAAHLRGTETVLIVEDEQAVRGLAKRILTAAGYHALTAANGGEALLHCERHGSKIHLVLTDVVMPQMGGGELVERLEKICPDLKTLYMSGYTDDAIVHHGVLEEGTQFIAKPFNVQSLLQKIREVLDSN